MIHALDVLVPTRARAGCLSVTLAGLAAQTLPALRVVVSDQTEPELGDPLGDRAVRAAVRVLEARGHAVELHRHLPRRGMAEQRAFLLSRAEARYAWFLDDDVWIEPTLAERLLRALRGAGCGFVGCGLVGLSFRDDVRLHEQDVAWWDGPVVPELVEPGSPAFARHRLHNAANLHHLRLRAGDGDRLYRVAWCGGCVAYDVQALRAVGGFGFWRALPREHSGEDVLAQLRVMARFGGAGLFPSGAYHQELDTTMPVRHADAWRLLPVVERAAA